jgi:GT2 family glycosyltransferase/LmbE family N-acetylglucosaminyl deacetylase
LRLLIFAAHPDDEILGCAGLILRVCRGGEALKVVIVTDGGAGGDAQTRRSESLEGLARLGAAAPEFWVETDGALPQSGPVLQRYRRLIEDWRPDVIALPAPSEDHPDHRRLTRGLLAAIAGRWSGELLFYETTTPMPFVNQVEPLELDAKLDALALHVSQLDQFDYAAHVRGLAMLRGAAAGTPAAEAYLSYHWDGSAQNFFEHRPLVSVVVRADDETFLRIALDSLCKQIYDHIEVIVVWHGGQVLPQAPAVLMCTVMRGPGGRSENLNAGLAAATGEYVAFLDQDDIWMPFHVEVLLSELRSDPRLDVAYGDYRIASCRRERDLVEVCDVAPTTGKDYRRGRLLAGNHIPLHSFLCRIALARRIGFDPALEAYEDWDFLGRAELGGAEFRRVPELVCEYRVFPLSGEAAELAVIHERRGYTAWRATVQSKFVRSLHAAGAASVLDLIRDLEAELDSTRAQAESLAGDRAAARQATAADRAGLAAIESWSELLAPQPIGTPAWSRLAGAAFVDGPVIGLILPVCDPQASFLIEAVESVNRQTYPHWQLCIADDASTSADIQALLDRLEACAASDNRLRIVRRPSRGGIVAASRCAVALCDAPWLAFLDHDDRLAPSALLEIAGELRRRPSLGALYTDSRTIDRNGGLLHTLRKPGWSPETLLHLNYINHLTVVRQDLYERIGGLSADAEGCQDWDLWLKLLALPDLEVGHIAQPLYDWRASETSVAYEPANKPYMVEAACRSLALHLTQRGLQGAVTATPSRGIGLRHDWAAKLEPLTAIILTHRNPADLKALLAILASSGYPGLEVIVMANNVARDDEATEMLLSEVQHRPGWRVMRDARAFNWSALNNAAARHATTPWLAFLNDDVDLVSTNALSLLARYLTLGPQVGAVGACLHYGDAVGGAVQHDGIVTDPAWVARNIAVNSDDAGMGLPRNVSAVTGACLLTPRWAFERCGGFDERLAVSFNDVDYCLHLRRLGLRIVQASDVTCIHHESRTRGTIDTAGKRDQLEREGDLMRRKWGDFLTEAHRMDNDYRRSGTRIMHVAQ